MMRETATVTRSLRRLKSTQCPGAVPLFVAIRVLPHLPLTEQPHPPSQASLPRTAPIVRSCCPRKNGTIGAARRLRAYSQTWCSSFSLKPLSELDLGSDPSIRRNASRAISVTRHCRDSGL